MLSAVFTTGISYGALKAKIDRLEKEVDKAKDEFVAVDLFNATIDPIRNDLHEMQKDIKKILVAVSKSNPQNNALE